MKPLNSEKIFGNWATLLLPIQKDNSISYELLDQQIAALISMRVDGIYSNGTAGEFYNQTEDEFDRINLCLATKCEVAHIPFQIGCSNVNPAMCLERIKRAVQMKPGAIQVILPDWITCDLNETRAFLGRVIEVAGDIGIVLYNPGHARTQLTPLDFFELKSAIPSLVGCKVPWIEKATIGEMAKLVPGVSMFVPGHHLATGFAHGAKGAYSNVACIQPGAAQNWFRSMKTSLNDALEVESRIQFFMRTCILPFIQDLGYSNTAADKFLAAIGGWSGITPRVRWPYKWIPESEVAAARSKCEKILPEFFLFENKLTS